MPLSLVVEYWFVDVSVWDTNVLVLVSVNNDDDDDDVILSIVVVSSGDEYIDELRVLSISVEGVVDGIKFVGVSVSIDDWTLLDTVLLRTNVEVLSSFTVVIESVDDWSEVSKVVNIWSLFEDISSWVNDCVWILVDEDVSSRDNVVVTSSVPEFEDKDDSIVTILVEVSVSVSNEDVKVLMVIVSSDNSDVEYSFVFDIVLSVFDVLVVLIIEMSVVVSETDWVVGDSNLMDELGLVSVFGLVVNIDVSDKVE